MIKVTKEIQIKPTVEQIADEICSMYATEQITLINLLGKISANWGAGALDAQLFSMQDENNENFIQLSNDGERLIRKLHDFLIK